MKLIKKIGACLTASLLLLGSAVLPVSADVVSQDASAFTSYTYDMWNNPVACPDPYVFRKSLSGVDLGIGEMKKLNDIYTAADGTLYLAIGGVAANENYILKMDAQLGLLEIFYGYKDDFTSVTVEESGVKISLTEGNTSGSARAEYTFAEGAVVKNWLLAYDFTIDGAKTPVQDAKGNPVLDGAGNPTYIEYAYAAPTISYNAYGEDYSAYTFSNNSLEVNLASQIARVAGVQTKRKTVNGTTMSMLPAGTYKGVLNLTQLIRASDEDASAANFVQRVQDWRMSLFDAGTTVTIREFAFVDGVGSDHVVDPKELEDIGTTEDTTEGTTGNEGAEGSEGETEGDSEGDDSAAEGDTAEGDPAAEGDAADGEIVDDGSAEGEENTEGEESAEGEEGTEEDSNASGGSSALLPPVPDDSTNTGTKVLVSNMAATWVQNIVQFRSPMGVFVDEDGTIFVADSTLRHIIKMDETANVKMIVDPPTPENSRGVITEDVAGRYRPSKLVVDQTGRIHVVALNINEGIMTFSEDGVFQSFLAAGKVNYSPIELFWRQFSTQEQIKQMDQFVPIEYNNIDIDKDGFLYATMAASDSAVVEGEIQSGIGTEQGALVRRLNLLGTDILKRNGYGPPVGDLAIWTNSDAAYTGISQIMDVSSGPNNTYMLLDNNRNHIFAYDAEGYLLYAFGGPDVTAGGLRTPTSLAQQGDYLYVLDTGTRSIIMYEKTAFAKNVAAAIAYESEGEIEKAGEAWQKVLNQNANYDLAYIGLGKIAYQNKDYITAMDYFEKSHEQDWYSKAYKQYRKILIADNFGLIAVVVIALVLVIVAWDIIRKRRLRKKEAERL